MNEFAHPHFAEPQWLWLATLGPLALALLFRYAAAARKRQLGRLAAPALLTALTRSHSPGRRMVKNALLLAALAAFGLALARPQWGEQQDVGRSLGQDTVFILDCSRSMLASDVLPSRLQRAKLAILDYLQRYGRGRVGLVAFAGQAFLQCPLTFDYDAFQDSLMTVDDKTIPVPGTDIGRGLDEGIRAMDKKSRVKLMVLLTDGEDLEQGGVRMAQELAKQGAVIFTIGVGTPAGAEIQFSDEQGREQVLEDHGQAVRSRLDETTLRAIAQATHGAYYSLGSTGEGLRRMRIAMDTFESQSGSAPGRKLGVDRFHLPVAAALVILVGESLIGTRRKVRH